MPKNSAKESNGNSKLQSEVTPELKDRALAASAEGITIANARLPDQPIIYANKGFERLTGYTTAEVVGRNCRFLQGEETESETVHQIRDAIRGDRPCSVEILNHKKDGSPFWNRLSITPVKDSSGITTHFIAIQSDITQRKNVEDALRRTKVSLEKANLKMKTDLEAAARVQQSMLPQSVPKIPGYDFAWHYRPCDELAGDTLNIIPLDKQNIALYALDVSGHGVQSALLSATLSHWLSPKPDQDTILESVLNYLERIPISPDRIATRLNRLFPMNLDHPQYFTLGYGLLNVSNHEFNYVSAGHPPSIHLDKNGKIRSLESSGPPIGLLENSKFVSEKIEIEPGDRVFLYTDGIIELLDQAGTEFGFDRLCETIREYQHRPINECLNELDKILNTWTGGESPDDDVSVVVLERLIN